MARSLMKICRRETRAIGFRLGALLWVVCLESNSFKCGSSTITMQRADYQSLALDCCTPLNQGDEDRKQKSGIIFDFRKETIVVKAYPTHGLHQLPPALRPCDAEISFDDITSHGIHMVHPQSFANQTSQTIMTVSTKRPPKFYTEFENSVQLSANAGARVGYRRRATAMDFALGPTVCRPLIPVWNNGVSSCLGMKSPTGSRSVAY